MINVGILYGGRSDEHDVSRCSAASVINALDRSKYDVTAIGIDRDGKWYVQDKPSIINDKDFGRIMELKREGRWFINHYEKENKMFFHNSETGKEVSVDILFPVVHGTYCEDGTLQGLLELAMVPFVGAGTAGSVIGMDKDIAKRLLRHAGISVVPWKTVSIRDWNRNSGKIIEEVTDDLGLPLFVKPACSGSSVGIKKVHTKEEIAHAVEFAFGFDNKILIEKAIRAREVECAVLGNDEPSASVIGEIITKHEFYSYEAKYIDADGAELVIPANIDSSLSDTIREAAVNIYKILNCSGMARVDFFIEKSSNTFYLNEINTLPGFTSISMYPKLWEYSGVSYKDLISRLIELAFERHRDLLGVRSISKNVDFVPLQRSKS